MANYTPKIFLIDIFLLSIVEFKTCFGFYLSLSKAMYFNELSLSKRVIS